MPESPADNERWWQTARARAEASGVECSGRRILQLRTVDGQVLAQVGEPADMGTDGSLVVGAIFESADSYVLAAVVGPIHPISKANLEAVDVDS